MSLNRIHTHFGRLLAVSITAAGLMAAEYHGTIKSRGLPVPGASVTAIKGDKKLYTTTDENGRYSFADIADGMWMIEVEMLGFAKLSNEVGIAFDAPAPEWNLKFLPMNATMAPPAVAAAPVATPTPAAASAPSGSAARGQQAKAGGGSQGGRGQNGANDGRPSLLAANGYQRVGVTSSGNLAATADTGMADSEMTDLSNSADPSLMVNGSVSRGLDMPGQNDWFGGPGGRMGMDGMGGPGDMTVMSAPGSDGSGGAQMGGRGSAGGGRGGPGGGMPGGGMAGGFGGRGVGGPGGGRGGRGGDGMGRGGPMGRAGVASFGNGRRDRRMQYNGNAAVTLDNSVWDARAYSINGQETPKPAYAKARATMMFGGPLKIPKLLDGTKGTFTLNYQLARTRNGSSSTQTMPTLLERTGDFSQSIGAQGPVTIYDPLTFSPFPGNAIPGNRLDPTSLGLLKYYPNPAR